MNRKSKERNGKNEMRTRKGKRAWTFCRSAWKKVFFSTEIFLLVLVRTKVEINSCHTTLCAFYHEMCRLDDLMDVMTGQLYHQRS